MKRLLLGLMLGLTATAAMAEWTDVSESDRFIIYVDKGTIRRNGNLVKMWELLDYKKVQTSPSTGVSYLSSKTQKEYDCKEEMHRLLALSWFSGKMGKGKVVYSGSETSINWVPIEPESVGETMWKIACGK